MIQAKKETGLIALKKVEADDAVKKKQQSTDTTGITEKVQLRKVERPTASPKQDSPSVRSSLSC
jgi:hypothetical protein